VPHQKKRSPSWGSDPQDGFLEPRAVQSDVKETRSRQEIQQKRYLWKPGLRKQVAQKLDFVVPLITAAGAVMKLNRTLERHCVRIVRKMTAVST